MKNNQARTLRRAGLLLICLAWTQAWAGDDSLPDNDVIMRALVDELGRSMNLQMEDLEKPYFIQYSVDDSINYQMSAAYGSLVSSDRQRTRRFFSQVRIGSFELDNTNFSSGGGGGFFGGGGGEGGGQASLPIEDDYQAIRQSMWWTTDNDYKDSVETLTRKRAYMEDKNIEDRPNDFCKAEVVELVEPGSELSFDRAAWESNLKKLSGYFKKYKQVQDSDVQLYVGAGNGYVVNSEGTRVRTGDSGVLLSLTAEVQCEDGMRISNGKTYTGDSTHDFPPMEQIMADVDKLVDELTRAMAAPVLEHYSGPVLFDGLAAAQMFKELLAADVAGKVDPVGQGRSAEGAEDLEKKIDLRILPKSFQIYDDPKVEKHGDKLLFGHYQYDDEGVAAQRVDIVTDGVLKNMVMSRVPTKKFSGSNGHGRRPPGSGSTRAAVGCLFIEDQDGVSDEEIKKQLIQAAKEEGLEYGIRVASIRTAGLGASEADMFSFFMSRQQRETKLGDPVFVYKVYVDGGREELVRGCEFGSFEVRDLKKIAAAGNKPTVYNFLDIGFAGASPPASIIAPPILISELGLGKIEQEHDKLPILKSPATRGG